MSTYLHGDLHGSFTDTCFLKLRGKDKSPQSVKLREDSVKYHVKGETRFGPEGQKGALDEVRKQDRIHGKSICPFPVKLP